MKEHEEGYSMPLAAPTYTAPPFYATPDSRILMMAYRADPAAVAFEVPEPLEPVEPNLMLAWIGDMGQPTHTIDLYHECLTGIKVRFKEWSGWYINYIWVDHDMALAFEREIYGWPANLCDNDPLLFHGSQVIGHCNRAGETLMRLSMNVTQPAAGPPQGRRDRGSFRRTDRGRLAPAAEVPGAGRGREAAQAGAADSAGGLHPPRNLVRPRPSRARQIRPLSAPAQAGAGRDPRHLVHEGILGGALPEGDL